MRKLLLFQIVQKDVFLCTYDVNYIEGSYQSKVIDSKSKEIITGYDTIQALENYDTNNNLWYENDVLLVSKSWKIWFGRF